MYDDDPFAPMGENTGVFAQAPAKTKEVKTPIIPVPADAPEFSFRHPRHGEPTGKWSYHQADGRVVGYAARFNFETAGKVGKEVLPITFCSVKRGKQTYTAWRSCGVPAPRPLYRLSQLAAAPSKPVIFTEGEAKADRAADLFPDHEATTTMGGAKAPHLTDFAPVAGRPVIVWPDHDEPGQEYARTVSELALAAGAVTAAIVNVPKNFPPKWDLDDALPPGATIADLNQFLVGATRVEIEEDSDITDENNETGGLPSKQADILVSLAADAELFHAPDNTNFADIDINGHRETWAVRRSGFRGWLTRRYYEETGGAPNSNALESALRVIEAKAQFDAPERAVHTRVGGLDGRLYLDLGDEMWRAVEIDTTGWRVIDNPPVRFRRAAGMQPLPMPVPGGSVETLRSFLNVKSGSHFILVVAWALAVLRNRGPYPVLVLSGEQGSAKSTFTAILRALLDPNTAPLRALPREDRDLFIAARNGHVLAYDNVSALPAWISDTLCRLATGGGFAVRQLYTDQDEVLFDATRPVILNGIEDIVTRPDLADRALFLTLEPIPEERRRPEAELWAAFEAERPRILGALLDAVAEGLRRLSETRLPKLPRMADFALWASACETAILPAGTFWTAYCGNRHEAIQDVIEADPVATAVRAIMRERMEWKGTASDLLEALSTMVGDAQRKAQTWPASPRALAGRLRRAASFLRQVGIEVAFRLEGRARTRTYHIFVAPENTGTRPSAPSASTAAGTECNDTKRFTTDSLQTVGDDADGRADEVGEGADTTVRDNRLKSHSAAVADDADGGCAADSAVDQKDLPWKARV